MWQSETNGCTLDGKDQGGLVQQGSRHCTVWKQNLKYFTKNGVTMFLMFYGVSPAGQDCFMPLFF